MEEINRVRHSYSMIGLGMAVMFILSNLLQILIAQIVAGHPEWNINNFLGWFLTMAPLYLIGLPLGLLLIRKAPATPVSEHKLRFRDWVRMLCISFFLFFSGNFVGIIINLLTGGLNRVSVNDLLTQDNSLMKVLVVVVIGPIIEEYLCRKQLIDRMHVYGERRAVFISALLFGLMHGNFTQMFYAFGIGLALGYIYLKTGKLRYTIAIHMFVNLLGGVLAPAILNLIDLSALESAATPDAILALDGDTGIGLTLLGFLLLFEFLMGIIGLVLLIIYAKKIRFQTAENEIPRGKRFSTSFVNLGMILFIVTCLTSAVLICAGLDILV